MDGGSRGFNQSDDAFIPNTYSKNNWMQFRNEHNWFPNIRWKQWVWCDHIYSIFFFFAMCNNDVPQTACYCLKKIFLLSQEFLTCCWWCLIQRNHNKPTWINHLSKQHPEKLLWETVSTRWLCGKHLKRARIQHKNTRLKQWGRGQSYCTSWGSHGGSPNRSS